MGLVKNQSSKSEEAIDYLCNSHGFELDFLVYLSKIISLAINKEIK